MCLQARLGSIFYLLVENFLSRSISYSITVAISVLKCAVVFSFFMFQFSAPRLHIEAGRAVFGSQCTTQTPHPLTLITQNIRKRLGGVCVCIDFSDRINSNNAQPQMQNLLEYFILFGYRLPITLLATPGPWPSFVVCPYGRALRKFHAWLHLWESKRLRLLSIFQHEMHVCVCRAHNNHNVLLLDFQVSPAECRDGMHRCVEVASSSEMRLFGCESYHFDIACAPSPNTDINCMKFVRMNKPIMC